MHGYPLGLLTVLPKDYVQWGKECDERRVIFAGSGEWLRVIVPFQCNRNMKEREV